MKFAIDVKNKLKVFYGGRLGEVRGTEPATREECIMWEWLEGSARLFVEHNRKVLPWGNPVKEQTT